MQDIEDNSDDERRRLNRRIHTITGTLAARNFARYRRHICKPSSVYNRDAKVVEVSFDGRTFEEPSDAVKLMHEWMNLAGVPTLQ